METTMTGGIGTVDSGDSLPSPRWWIWAGRVASALPVLALGMSAFMKLSHNPQMVPMFVNKLGYPENLLTGLGLLELFCVVLYVIPQTAVLGGILVAGYLGGAVATHVRVSDAFLVPLALGVLAWVGLYLRDARVRELLPLRRSS